MLRSLSIVPVLMFLIACGGADQTASKPRAPVRLIDELGSAEIDSPLVEFAPLAGAVAAGAGQWKEVWNVDLTAGPGCKQGEAGVLECEVFDAPIDLAFARELEPSRYYRAVFDGKTSDPGCLFYGVEDLLWTRWSPVPGDASGWHQVSSTWFAELEKSSRRTRLLVNGTKTLAGPCKFSVRSIKVFEVAPGGQEELALLAAEELAPGADPKLGMAKFGLLLPLEAPHLVAPPFDENYSSREALFAPAPTDLRFALEIPERSRLLFSYSLSRESQIGDQVDFEVLVRPEGGEEESVWSQRVDLSPGNWKWSHARVDLERFWGRPVELTLRTRSSGARGYALWGAPVLDVPRLAEDPPNVIVIAVDTLRADRLTSFGYPGPLTPRLDEFARDGVSFHNAISSANTTILSFYSLFTGRVVPGHHAFDLFDRYRVELPTMTEILRDQGWRTHAVLFKSPLYRHIRQGFETYVNVPIFLQKADMNVTLASKWMDLIGDRRFFFFLHFDDPHQPFTQPDEFVRAASKSGLQRHNLALPMLFEPTIAACESCMDGEVVVDDVKTLGRDLYDEEIAYLDSRIGMFLDELREAGLYDDAIIAFVADHGETLWNHYEFFGHGGVNQHDEVLRVPLIIKPPAGFDFRRGAIEKTQVRSFDMMPTLLELAGVEVDEASIDARSLVPCMRGPCDDIPSEALSMSWVSASMRDGRWKYIYPIGEGISQFYETISKIDSDELYDLKADPQELKDVSAEFPEVLDTMRRKTVDYLIQTVGGTFLLVTGEGSVADYEIKTTCSACDWDRFGQLGLRRQPGDRPSDAVFGGKAVSQPVLLLARVLGPPEAVVNVEMTRTASTPGEPIRRQFELGDSEPYRRGSLNDYVERPGIYLISSPSRTPKKVESAASTEIDLQQLERMKTLGYVQ